MARVHRSVLAWFCRRYKKQADKNVGITYFSYHVRFLVLLRTQGLCWTHDVSSLFCCKLTPSGLCGIRSAAFLGKLRLSNLKLPKVVRSEGGVHTWNSCFYCSFSKIFIYLLFFQIFTAVSPPSLPLSFRSIHPPFTFKKEQASQGYQPSIA